MLVFRPILLGLLKFPQHGMLYYWHSNFQNRNFHYTLIQKIVPLRISETQAVSEPEKTEGHKSTSPSNHKSYRLQPASEHQKQLTTWKHKRATTHQCPDMVPSTLSTFRGEMGASAWSFTQSSPTACIRELPTQQCSLLSEQGEYWGPCLVLKATETPETPGSILSWCTISCLIHSHPYAGKRITQSSSKRILLKVDGVYFRGKWLISRAHKFVNYVGPSSLHR